MIRIRATGMNGFKYLQNRTRLMITQIKGGVTSAQGFKAAGIAAGIKKAGRKDLAMLYSEKVCQVAGTFTSNVVKAAPVKWDYHIARELGQAQACVMNSGIANACTGEAGMDACRRTAEKAGKVLGIDPMLVLTASTGVIGAQLPVDRIENGIETLAELLSDNAGAGTQAEEAIMTTDTRPKECAVTVEIDGKTVTVGGMSKGAGMIHPLMCTMLAFITTDCNIEQSLLQEALSDSIADTYNMISVDGDTSTNDTCLLFANGLAGNSQITEKGEAYHAFCEALNYVNTMLARQMAADGEGATALFEVKVVGAEDKQQAVTLAKSIVTSSLVKTAIAGHDANWGRILCAMGYSGAQFDPEKVDLYFESSAGKLQIIRDGVSTGYSEEKATEILSQKEITATADIHMGEASATAWGCDLTHEYISINADYRS